MLLGTFERNEIHKTNNNTTNKKKYRIRMYKHYMCPNDVYYLFIIVFVLQTTVHGLFGSNFESIQ